MNLYNDEIGVDMLSDDQWERIAAVPAFLRPPRQVMELLAADRKTSLDLVSASITHLIKHCKNGETTFKDTDQDLTMAGMKGKATQETSRSGIGYRGSVPKPTATEADQSYGDGPDHSSDSLSNSAPILEQCCSANSST